jgi:hypothetical protein
MNHPVHDICIVLVYHILVVSDSLDWVITAKAHIRQQFNINDFGPATSILSMDIARDLSTVRLSQEKCTTKLLEKYGRLDSKPSTLSVSPTQYRDADSASLSD